MQDLLTKGIDENGNIRSEETHEFKDSAIGRIPVEWDVKTLADLAEVDRGKFTHRHETIRNFMVVTIPLFRLEI